MLRQTFGEVFRAAETGRTVHTASQSAHEPRRGRLTRWSGREDLNLRPGMAARPGRPGRHLTSQGGQSANGQVPPR